MIKVIDLPMERAWKNSPVIKLVLNDTRYMALFDSGAMIPMYFGDQETLEKELGGQVLAEEEFIRGIGGKGMNLKMVTCSVVIDQLTFPNMKMAWLPNTGYQFLFLLSYTMFRGSRILLDDDFGRLEVSVEQAPDMYVRTPFIVRKDGSIFALCAEPGDSKADQG